MVGWFVGWLGVHPAGLEWPPFPHIHTNAPPKTHCRSKAETALRRAQYLTTPLRAPVSMKLPLWDHCMHLMAVSCACVAS